MQRLQFLFLTFKLDKKAEVTVTLPNKRVLKAEVIKDDVMAAMDEGC